MYCTKCIKFLSNMKSKVFPYSKIFKQGRPCCRRVHSVDVKEIQICAIQRQVYSMEAVQKHILDIVAKLENELKQRLIYIETEMRYMGMHIRELMDEESDCGSDDGIQYENSQAPPIRGLEYVPNQKKKKTVK